MKDKEQNKRINRKTKQLSIRWLNRRKKRHIKKRKRWEIWNKRSKASRRLG